MELKQNEFLPAERQIVTAEPELKTVGFGGPFLSVFLFIEILNKTKVALASDQVQLSEDDEFIVLACDGIWYDLYFSTECNFVIIQLFSSTRIRLHSFFFYFASY
jgi:protein phosphatase 1G